jgi:hypothetical protein
VKQPIFFPYWRHPEARELGVRAAAMREELEARAFRGRLLAALGKLAPRHPLTAGDVGRILRESVAGVGGELRALLMGWGEREFLAFADEAIREALAREAMESSASATLCQCGHPQKFHRKVNECNLCACPWFRPR